MRGLLAIVVLMLVSVTGWAENSPAAGTITQGSLKTAYGTSFNILSEGQADAPLTVLLVPGKWGLNDELKGWLKALAGHGVRVVALDLFDGRPVRNAYMATDVWNSIDPVWIAADLDGAVMSLSQQGRHLVIMSWADSLPFVQSALARHPQQVQGLIAVGRQVSVDVPLLLLNQADRSAAGSVRQFLSRWH